MRYPLLVLCLCSALAAAESDGQWRPVWNGKDLQQWTTWLRRPEPTSHVPGLPRADDGRYRDVLGERDPLQVFTVVPVDGRPAIRISGEVFGELRTRESFTNYRLRLQFKWGQKKWPPRDQPATPRDSGLLYHVHTAPGAEGRTFARSIELQIQEGDVGDLYSIGSQINVRSTYRKDSAPALFDYDPKGEWRAFSQLPGLDGRCIKQPDNEKPTGQWNTVEIVCVGEDAIHIVNGKVVMRLHGPRAINRDVPTPLTSGPIILQSEGAEIFYRDFEVMPLQEIPAEFRE